MDEGRCLENVAAWLRPQASARQPAQFVIHQRDEAFECLLITLLPREKHRGDVRPIRIFGHDFDGAERVHTPSSRASPYTYLRWADPYLCSKLGINVWTLNSEFQTHSLISDHLSKPATFSLSAILIASAKAD